MPTTADSSPTGAPDSAATNSPAPAFRVPDRRAGLRGLGRVRSVSWLAGATIAALVIRAALISRQSLWFDETATVLVLRGNATHVWHTIEHLESNPPGYYALAWLWTHLTRVSALGMRSLSIAAGVATVPAAWLAARDLADRRAAQLAAVLVAASPFLVWYSQEARNYALFALLATLTIATFARALRSPTSRTLLVWSLSVCLLLATHYFGLFLVVGEAAVLLAQLRTRPLHEAVRLATITAAPIVALSAALTPLALQQQGSHRTTWIAAAGSLPHRISGLASQFIGGPLASMHTARTAALVVASLALIVYAVAARAHRSGALALVVCLATTTLLPIAAALAGNDYILARNLAPAVPALLCLIAIGMAALPRRAATFGALALVTVLMLVADVHQLTRPDRQTWRAATAALGPRVDARTVLVAPTIDRIPIIAYRPGFHDVGASSTWVTSRIDLVIGHRRQSPLGRGASSAIPAPAGGFHQTRVWNNRQFRIVTFTSTMPVAVRLDELERPYGMRLSALLEQAHGMPPTPTS